MNKFTKLGVGVLLGCVLTGCGEDSEAGGPPPSDASSYDRTFVPVDRPSGLTAVHAQDYADHDVSGQNLRFSFGPETLYSCLRPEGTEVSAVGVGKDRRLDVMACPQEGKRVLRVIDHDGYETVFSVDGDPVEGKGSTDPEEDSDIAKFVWAAEFEASPEWLLAEVSSEGE